MERYVGLDVSLDQTSVCIVDSAGAIVAEAKVASDPGALAAYLDKVAGRVVRVGLEAGPLSQWLRAGLTAAAFDIVLLETRHVKAALSAMIVKTDRRDTRGIAQLLRMGWFRPVHAKALPAQEVRALLTARKLLLTKFIDLELSIRGILRGFGLKVGPVSRGRFEERVRDLAAGQEVVELAVDALLVARAALRRETDKLTKRLLRMARQSDVCRRLMTAPGVGALTALTFVTAIDNPKRLGKSKEVGPLFGLTPRRYQSGETDVIGRISKAGDVMARTALYEAASSMLTRTKRMNALKRWAMNVAKRRGHKRALVALARKLGTVLHRMWIDGTEFRWSRTDGRAMTEA